MKKGMVEGREINTFPNARSNRTGTAKKILKNWITWEMHNFNIEEEAMEEVEAVRAEKNRRNNSTNRLSTKSNGKKRILKSRSTWKTGRINEVIKRAAAFPIALKIVRRNESFFWGWRYVTNDFFRYCAVSDIIVPVVTLCSKSLLKRPIERANFERKSFEGKGKVVSGNDGRDGSVESVERVESVVDGNSGVVKEFKNL